MNIFRDGLDDANYYLISEQPVYLAAIDTVRSPRGYLLRLFKLCADVKGEAEALAELRHGSYVDDAIIERNIVLLERDVDSAAEFRVSFVVRDRTVHFTEDYLRAYPTDTEIGNIVDCVRIKGLEWRDVSV